MRYAVCQHKKAINDIDDISFIIEDIEIAPNLRCNVNVSSIHNQSFNLYDYFPKPTPAENQRGSSITLYGAEINGFIKRYNFLKEYNSSITLNDGTIVTGTIYKFYNSTLLSKEEYFISKSSI